MKAIYFFLFALILNSCALKINVPKGDLPVIPKGYYSAGAAQVDITPPPGYSMGGFGNELSKIARGWWTKLYAKSYYYEDPSGNMLVIVAADLWSVSQGLCDKVMYYLHKQGNAYKLPREWVLVTATHTHHSQGNFSSSMGYNLGSSALMGFDEELFNFLAQRIAYSIKLAIDKKEAADIFYAYRDVPGHTRNRSLAAFYQNDQQEQNEILDNIQFDPSFLHESSYCFTQDTNIFKAVDPTLTSIVTKKQGTQEIQSVLSVFGVHPTVMGPKNALISSDIFGISSLTVANYLKSQSVNSVVVGYLNGQNGDVSGNWYRQDRPNSERIGQAIGNATLENIFSNQLIQVKTEIISKLDFKVIRGAVINGQYPDLACGSGVIQRMASIPSMGKPSKKGAEDGRTHHICLEEECYFQEGDPKDHCQGPQGNKKEMAITKIISGSAPELLAVGLYNIGDLKIVSLPGETTTALGERLKKTAEQNSDNHVVLVSLANDYASYFTTPSEYKAQHYEGASTIYGMATGYFFQEFIEWMKLRPARSDGYYKKKKYDVGPKLNRKSIERKWSDYPWNFKDDLFSVFHSFSPTELKRYFAFEWNYPIELEKPLKGINYGPSVSSVKIMVQDGPSQWNTLSIQSSVPFGAYEEIQSDTTSSNFISYIKTNEDLSFSWESIWLIPESYQSSKVHKMVINTQDGRILESQNFFVPQN
jgi:neutral ceramidase